MVSLIFGRETESYIGFNLDYGGNNGAFSDKLTFLNSIHNHESETFLESDAVSQFSPLMTVDEQSSEEVLEDVTLIVPLRSSHKECDNNKNGFFMVGRYNNLALRVFPKCSFCIIIFLIHHSEKMKIGVRVN